MFNDESYYSNIRNFLIMRARAVQVDCKSNLMNLSVLSEEYYEQILNALLDCNLVNANTANQNEHGYDLIDKSKRIIVQVSATCNSTNIRKKIQNSIDACKIDEGKWQFYYVPITESVPNLKKDFKLPNWCLFNKKSDVLDINRIMQLVRDTNIETKQKISEIVDKYYSNNSVLSDCQNDDNVDFDISSMLPETDATRILIEKVNKTIESGNYCDVIQMALDAVQIAEASDEDDKKMYRIAFAKFTSITIMTVFPEKAQLAIGYITDIFNGGVFSKSKHKQCYLYALWAYFSILENDINAAKEALKKARIYEITIDDTLVCDDIDGNIHLYEGQFPKAIDLFNIQYGKLKLYLQKNAHNSPKSNWKQSSE